MVSKSTRYIQPIFSNRKLHWLLQRDTVVFFYNYLKKIQLNMLVGGILLACFCHHSNKHC